MIRSILLACGLTAASVGTWRGYANARLALLPLVADGDPTRRSVEAARPLVARPRVRRFLRGAATALVWLVIAMYGLLLVATAGRLP